MFTIWQILSESFSDIPNIPNLLSLSDSIVWSCVSNVLKIIKISQTTWDFLSNIFMNTEKRENHRQQNTEKYTPGNIMI